VAVESRQEWRLRRDVKLAREWPLEKASVSETASVWGKVSFSEVQSELKKTSGLA
jgi:hypothetical protein